MLVRRQVRPTSLLVSSLVATALAFTAGCGDGDDDAACDAIIQQLDKVSSSASQFANDPAAMGELYTSAAGEIKVAAEGAGENVKGAASTVVGTLEVLGPATADSADGRPADTTDYVTAAAEMRDVC